MNSLNRNRRGLVIGCLVVCLVALVACVAICAGVLHGDTAACGVGASALGMGLLLKDALLKVTKTLPASATTATSSAIDLGHGSRGDWLATIEFKLSAPAVLTTELDDDDTLTYDIIQGDSSDLTSSPTTVYPGVIVQTGAGAAGAIAATKTVRLPIDVKRYVGVKATKTGSDDASAKSMTFEALC